MTLKILLAVALALSAAGRAQAQEISVPRPPLVSYSYAAAAPPLVPLTEAKRLERSGQRNQIAGVVLMSLGGALALNGAGAAGYGVSHLEGATLIAGTAVAAVGLGALVAGIPVYVVGKQQVQRAQLSLAPTVGGASVNAAFRF